MFYHVTTRDGTLILQSFIKDRGGNLVDQPSGYPKITIYLMEGTGSTEVVAETQMSEDVNGEYYYEWTLPTTTPGTYKARVVASIDGVDFSGFDVIHVKLAEDQYSGEGK